LVTAHGASFPSGHAANATLVCVVGTLIAFLFAPRRAIRTATVTLACLVIAAVAFSRVELGVHWTTDVIAGCLVTTVWLAAIARAFSPTPSPAAPDHDRHGFVECPGSLLVPRTTCDSAFMPVVVHLSDIHFGAHRPDLVDSLLSDILSVGPDLTVLSGDLTQRARRSQFEQARLFIDRLPATLLTVVGNHDLPLINLPRRFLSDTRRYEHYITRDLDPVVVLPGVVAVGLDTMRAWRWKAGHVSRRQVAIVRTAFGNVPQGVWRLVVTHHPVLPSHLSGLIGRDLLVDACAESDVAILLSGHTHTPSAHVVDLDAPGVRRQELALVAGTAISRRTRGAGNAYEVLHLDGGMVEGGRVTVRLRAPTSTGWSDRDTTHFEFTSDGVVGGQESA